MPYDEMVYGTDTLEVSQSSLRLFRICITFPLIPLQFQTLRQLIQSDSKPIKPKGRRAKKTNSSAMTPEIPPKIIYRIRFVAVSIR